MLDLGELLLDVALMVVVNQDNGTDGFFALLPFVSYQ
jgi:hypothetical protein